MRIALLEDDVDQAAAIVAWLGALDCKVSHFEQGNDLIKTLRREHFDLFLLDWQLPDISGIQVLEWIRQHLDWAVPIIFLTMRKAEEDIVQALNAGADDYIVKPLSAEVTLARVRNVLRRSGQISPQESGLQAEPYRIDLIAKTISLGDEAINLTQREFDLAAYIFRNSGKVLSRETLLQEVWGVTATINTRTVDTHVCRLRRKLAIMPENGWRLQSIYQYGYRLEPATLAAA